MSENSDTPFSFTDKRKYRDGEGTNGTEPQGSVPASQPDAEPQLNTEPQADASSASPATEASTEPQPGVDDLSAEAGALYDDAVREADSLKARVAELEEQQKRDQAEYVNSRRRIEQSAAAGRQEAATKVLISMFGVLDEIELARQHGDLTEGTPFASIAAKVEEATGQHGLERFGQVGEEFNPELHEALMHTGSDEAESTTLQVIMQPGYKIGGRVIRPARVGTVGPN